MTPYEWLGNGADCWKATGPDGKDIIGDAFKALDNEYYHVTPDGKGLVFKCPVTGGGTTTNTKYMRMENRQMKPGGKARVAWSNITGVHFLELWQQVDVLPHDRNHVVCGQIHGTLNPNDDVCVFRLEGSSLWITNDNETHGCLVTDKYELGTSFTCGFYAKDGKITFSYNGKPVLDKSGNVYTQTKELTDSYFKFGIYPQCKTGNDYGQATVLGWRMGNDGVVVGNWDGTNTGTQQPPVVEPPPTPPDPTPTEPPTPVDPTIQILQDIFDLLKTLATHLGVK